MTIRLNSQKEVTGYLSQYNHANFSRYNETSENFGSFTTYYIGYTPILQVNLPTIGKNSVIGLIDFAPVNVKKVLEIN